MKKAQTKKVLIIMISVIVLIVLFFLRMMSGGADIRTAEMKMFDDLAQLDFLNEYVIDDIPTDKNLGKINPIAGFTKKVEWEKQKYEVYAYEFESVEELSVYYEKVGGYWVGDQYGWHFKGNSLFNTSAVLYYDRYILYVNGPSDKATVAFLTWLTADFSHTVKSFQKFTWQ
ncbi:MAG: hypothetical protein IKJ63_04455 [Clostridia bacterium]|nr:hypothetical protein [Clostridia bacterium]